MQSFYYRENKQLVQKLWVNANRLVMARIQGGFFSNLVNFLTRGGCFFLRCNYALQSSEHIEWVGRHILISLETIKIQGRVLCKIWCSSSVKWKQKAFLWGFGTVVTPHVGPLQKATITGIKCGHVKGSNSCLAVLSCSNSSNCQMECQRNKNVMVNCVNIGHWSNKKSDIVHEKYTCNVKKWGLIN